MLNPDSYKILYKKWNMGSTCNMGYLTLAKVYEYISKIVNYIQQYF